jgi:hypothetical protein
VAVAQDRLADRLALGRNLQLLLQVMVQRIAGAALAVAPVVILQQVVLV